MVYGDEQAMLDFREEHSSAVFCVLEQSNCLASCMYLRDLQSAILFRTFYTACICWSGGSHRRFRSRILVGNMRTDGGHIRWPVACNHRSVVVLWRWGKNDAAGVRTRRESSIGRRLGVDGPAVGSHRYIFEVSSVTRVPRADPRHCADMPLHFHGTGTALALNRVCWTLAAYPYVHGKSALIYTVYYIILL